MATYKYATTLEGPDGDDVDVSVSFGVAWGTPESGRFGPPEDYDPGSGDEIEDVKILTVNGVAPTKVQELYYMLSIEACYEDMLNEASQDRQAEADDAAEHRAQMRREDW